MMFEKLERTDEHAPNLRARLVLPSRFVGRAYVHAGGSDTAYGSRTTEGPLEVTAGTLAIAHLEEVLQILSPGNDPDYVLAIMWGLDKAKMIDWFCFSDLGEWPGNPSVEAIVTRDGHVAHDKPEITCGDGLILLGQEEAYRRRTPNLEGYLRNPPPIEGLSPRG